MPNGISVGADVTPEFNERIEAIQEDRQDAHKSETVRHLLREGAAQVDESSFAEKIFKNLALGLAMVALVGYLWASQAGYPRPIYVGVVWMIPSVACLWLCELWPGLRARFGTSTESVNPSEA